MTKKGSSLYLSDCMTGLLAALASQGVQTIDGGERTQSALLRALPIIADSAPKHLLELRFDPKAQKGYDIDNELCAAIGRGILGSSIPNPEGILRIRISQTDAPIFLEGVPGSPDMYRSFAEEFLKAYREIA